MRQYYVNLQVDGICGSSSPMLNDDYICNCLETCNEPNAASSEPVAIIRKAKSNGYWFLGCPKWNWQDDAKKKKDETYIVPWCNYFQWVHREMLLNHNPLNAVRTFPNISSSSSTSSSASQFINSSGPESTQLEHNDDNDM